MMVDDLHAEGVKAIPGVLGSLFSALFFKETSIVRMGGMFLAGVGTAWYIGPWAAARSGLPEGAAGFLVGLFGVAVIQKLFDVWSNADLGSILSDWIRKILGLPPKTQ